MLFEQMRGFSANHRCLRLTHTNPAGKVLATTCTHAWPHLHLTPPFKGTISKMFFTARFSWFTVCRPKQSVWAATLPSTSALHPQTTPRLLCESCYSPDAIIPLHALTLYIAIFNNSLHLKLLNFAKCPLKPCCTSPNTDPRSPSNLCSAALLSLGWLFSGLPHYGASPCSLASPRGLVIDKRCTEQPGRLDRLATEARWTSEWEWSEFIRAQRHRSWCCS